MLRRPLGSVRSGASVYRRRFDRRGLFPLKVSSNGRYLESLDHTPFLLTGDAPQAMNKITTTQMSSFYSTRESQGFNAQWVNLLAADAMFANVDGSTYDGIRPFTSGTAPTSYDMATPNSSYFARVDSMIRLAADHNQLVFADPAETISDWGTGSSEYWLNMLRNNGQTKCFNYGAYLGSRYFNDRNIIWMNGNDFQNYTDATDSALVLKIMQGIRSTAPHHRQTCELKFPASTTLDGATQFGSEVNLNLAYSYYAVYQYVVHGYNQTPTMPTIMIESNYENSNYGSGGDCPETLLRMRKQAYWSMCSGACGQFYGNDLVWKFNAGWDTDLSTTEVTEFIRCKSFFATLQWWKIEPDLTEAVVTAGRGTAGSDLSVCASSYAMAGRTSDGQTVVCYTPGDKTLTVDMTKLSGPNVQSRWYDPTNGNYTAISGSPFANTGTHNFVSPGANSSGDHDWLLHLESVT